MSPDFIWYDFGIATKPLFYSEEQAREKLEEIGVLEPQLKVILSEIRLIFLEYSRSLNGII